MRQRLFKTDIGVVVLGYDDSGNIVGRSIEPNIEKASPKPATGKAMVILVKNYYKERKTMNYSIKEVVEQ